MKRHVIFDLDGTLVDSVAICAEIINSMLADRGAGSAVSLDEAAAQVSRGGRDMCAALLGQWCGDPDVEIIEFRKRYATSRTPDSSLFDGARALLEEARAAGAGTAICSNKPQALCEKVLADLDMLHLFDVVVGGQASHAPKPAPDLLQLCLMQLGASPSECLYVGDSELDHQVATQLNMSFIHVEHGYGECVDGLPVFHRARSLDDLTPVMLKWCGPERRKARVPRRR